MIGGHPAGTWSRGRGPLRRLAPEARLVCWVLLVAACLLASPSRVEGLVLTAVLIGGWLLACGIQPRTAMRLLALGLLLFLPAFLLLPWTGRSTEVSCFSGLCIRRDAWVAPLHLVVRSLACLLLCAGLVLALTEAELQQALARLPVPRLLLTMVHQVLRSLGPLLTEAVGVGRAISLRGGRGGWRAALMLPRALFLTWLPRVLGRAERVSRAMQVRGYGGELMESPGSAWSFVDALGLSLAGSCLALAVLLR